MAFGSDTITVRFPEPLYTQVRECASKTNRTYSDVIRAALKEYLTRYGGDEGKKEEMKKAQ